MAETRPQARTHSDPVKLLIDTDISVDVDDVGALCIAHALADRGEAQILGVVHDINLAAGIGAVSAISHYFGRDDLPLGAYRGPVVAGVQGDFPEFMRNGRGVYVDAVVQAFKPRIQNASQVPDAVEVYRRALAATDPQSVVVVCIGHATNLFDLLKSTDGASLVASRVRKLVFMGGFKGSPRVYTDPLYKGEVEWNFGACGGGCGGYDVIGNITRNALALWPSQVPITFVGFRTGEGVFTGSSSLLSERPGSPCAFAYHHFCAELEWNCGLWWGRQSWDPMAVLYAVRGDTHGYYIEAAGSLRVESSGHSRWTPAEQGLSTACPSSTLPPLLPIGIPSWCRSEHKSEHPH